MWIRLLGILYCGALVTDRFLSISQRPSQLSMTPETRIRQVLEAHMFPADESALSSETLRGEIDYGRSAIVNSLAGDFSTLPDEATAVRELHLAIAPLVRRISFLKAPRSADTLLPLISAILNMLVYRTRSLKPRYKAVLESPAMVTRLAQLFEPEWVGSAVGGAASSVRSAVDMPSATGSLAFGIGPRLLTSSQIGGALSIPGGSQLGSDMTGHIRAYDVQPPQPPLPPPVLRPPALPQPARRLRGTRNNATQPQANSSTDDTTVVPPVPAAQSLPDMIIAIVDSSVAFVIS